MTTNFVAKGTEILKQAIQKDIAEEYEAALSLYSQGIQYLTTGLKYETNYQVQQAIKEKVQKYLMRAEDIKTSLSDPPKKYKKKKTVPIYAFEESDDDEDTAIMKSTTNFVVKGTEILKRAIRKDNSEEYEAALSLYSQGIQYYMTGLKYEKNQRVVLAIKEKVQKYLRRAEDIKTSFEEPPKKYKKKKTVPIYAFEESEDDDELTAIMTSTTNFVSKGTELIKQAVYKDNAEEYEAALSLYSQGIQYLMTGLKYEHNRKVVSAIKQNVQKYLRRAEDIKTCLEEPPKQYKQKKNKQKKRYPFKESDSDDEDKEEDQDSAIVVMKKPNIKWDDVAGLETAKQLLKEAVILPIKFPQLFQRKRQPYAGILLYGPPGTGKTYLANAIATETGNSTFFSVSSSDLMSTNIGESEQLVKNLFNIARKKKPSIIFIDKVDSLASGILGVVKHTHGVFTLGATNCPWNLDQAILRRFVKRIYIPLPDKEAREHMFKIHIGITPNSLTDQDFAIMAEKTDGFSGSDISAIVQRGLMEPVIAMSSATHFVKQRDPEHKCPYIWLPCSPTTPGAVQMSLMNIPENEQHYVRAGKVKLYHFLTALQDAEPSIAKRDIKRYHDWAATFGY